jgi:hypothetical protein
VAVEVLAAAATVVAPASRTAAVLDTPGGRVAVHVWRTLAQALASGWGRGANVAAPIAAHAGWQAAARVCTACVDCSRGSRPIECALTCTHVFAPSPPAWGTGRRGLLDSPRSSTPCAVRGRVGWEGLFRCSPSMQCWQARSRGRTPSCGCWRGRSSCLVHGPTVTLSPPSLPWRAQERVSSRRWSTGSVRRSRAYMRHTGWYLCAHRKVLTAAARPCADDDDAGVRLAVVQVVGAWSGRLSDRAAAAYARRYVGPHVCVDASGGAVRMTLGCSRWRLWGTGPGGTMYRRQCVRAPGLCAPPQGRRLRGRAYRYVRGPRDARATAHTS